MLKDTNTISRNIEEAYHNGKYIVTENKVYQPFYSKNAGYYAHLVYTEQSGKMTHKGRFFHMTGDEVNHLIGINLLANM